MSQSVKWNRGFRYKYAVEALMFRRANAGLSKPPQQYLVIADQVPVVTVVRQDAVQTRVTQPPFGRNQLFGSLAYQRTTTESTNLFGFEDSTLVSLIDRMAPKVGRIL